MNRGKSAGQSSVTKAGRHVALLFMTLALFSMAHVSVAAGRIFYDGFESGNTNLWEQDDFRNRCQVVTSAADGGAGPFAGSRMLRCNDNGTVAWSDPAAFETLVIDNLNYSTELFIRTRMRPDTNLARTASSPKKLLRIFNWNGVQSTYNDIYEVIYTANGLRNEGLAAGSQFATYWGGLAGDNTGSTSNWHKVEYYINTSGTIKVWHDGILVRNNTSLTTGNAKWLPINITSNWSDVHDATNYLYFDEFEVFTDTGSGASGTMSNATVSASGPPPVISPPPNLRVF